MNDLSKRREARLFSQMRRTGDSALREELIRRYLPLARHTARRFQRSSDSLEDLYQVASYALVKAIDGFDPDRGLAFTSYAIPTMSGELKRHARNTGWGLHVPRGLQERILDIERTVSDLTSQNGRSPSVAQIAGAIGLTHEEVLEGMEAATSHVLESLDVPIGVDADASSRGDLIGAEDPNYGLVEDAHAVAPALRALAERERRIIELRFGEELSQSEIARRLGISQMHVSRLLRRTLDDLAQQVDTATAAAAG